MLRKMLLDGLKLPDVFIAEDDADAREAVELGLPYIVWPYGDRELYRRVLLPTLRSLFPDLKKPRLEAGEPLSSVVVLNLPEGMGYGDDLDGTVDRTHDVGVASTRSRYAMATGRAGNEIVLEDMVGVYDEIVVLDHLSDLGLLPRFAADLAEGIRSNLQRYAYREGWNKRLGAPVGRFDTGYELPNLVMIDVSASIPKGVSSTMIALAATLRTQCNADLLFHSDGALFYRKEDALPEPDGIRRGLGWCNSSSGFAEDLVGSGIRSRYGTVIAFGDNDYLREVYEDKLPHVSAVKVMHYHTMGKGSCGFATWFDCDDAEHMGNGWCKWMRKG